MEQKQDEFATLDQQLSSNVRQQKDIQAKPDPFAELDKQLSASGVQQAPASLGVTISGHDQGALMAGIENFNRVFGSMSEGALDLVARITGADKLKASIKQTHDSLQASADKSAQQHPIASAVGTGAGILASAAIPMGGTTGSLANRVLTNAGIGGAMGFTNYADNMGDRFKNAAGSALISGALPVAMEGYGKALGDVGQRLGFLPSNSTVQAGSGLMNKALSPDTAVAKDVNAEIANAGMTEQMLANKAKFNSLGIRSAVSDVAQSPGIDSKLAGVGMDTAKRGEITQFRTAQTGEVQSALTKQMDQLIPGGLAADTKIKNAMYKNLDSIEVPEEAMTKLMSNPSIAKRLESVNKDVDTGMANLPDNTFGKMEALRKSLAKDAYGIDTDPTASANLRGVLKDFTKTLDDINPTYKATRQAGDRISMYNEFKDELAKGAPKGGSGNTLDLDQMYTRLFGTGEKQQTFLDAVQRAGGNVNNSKDLIDVMNLLKGNKLDKLVTKADDRSTVGILEPLGSAATGAILGGPGGALVGAALGLAHSIGKFMTKTRYQDAFLKLNLSPVWQPELAKVLTKKGSAKLLGLTDLLRKVANTSVGSKAVKGSIPMLGPILTGNNQE